SKTSCVPKHANASSSASPPTASPAGTTRSSAAPTSNVSSLGGRSLALVRRSPPGESCVLPRAADTRRRCGSQRRRSATARVDDALEAYVTCGGAGIVGLHPWCANLPSCARRVQTDDPRAPARGPPLLERRRRELLLFERRDGDRDRGARV